MDIQYCCMFLRLSLFFSSKLNTDSRFSDYNNAAVWHNHIMCSYLRLSFSFRSVFIYIRQLRLHANDSNTLTLRSPFKIKAQFGS